MSRLTRIMDVPTALLPLWLLAAIVLAATAAASAASAASAAGLPPLAAVAIAAALSWTAAVGSRIALARRGRTGFEDMPSADLDYNDSPSVQGIAQLLNTAVWIGVGASAGALVRAVGIRAADDVWGVFPAWFAIGVVAAAPALTEADARYGLWIRRRRLREEDEIRGAGRSLAAGPARGPSPVVPLARGKAWAFVAMTGLAAAGCAAGAIAGDLGPIERIALVVAAPVLVFVATEFARIARAPHFLRLTPTGADLLATGEIPWEAIDLADVSAHSSARWLTLSLAEPLADQPWVTPGIRRLAKRSKGEAVEAMLRFSARPAREIAAELDRTGRVEVEAFLA